MKENQINNPANLIAEKKIDDHGIDRDYQSKKIIRFLNIATNIEGFENKKIEEIFSTEENKRQFIDKIDFKEFLVLLNGINGLFRGKTKDDWKIDGERVFIGNKDGLIEYKPPHPDDKLELLEKLVETAKRMNKKGVDLEHIGGMIYSVVNSIHLYADGNGRSSRFLYGLMHFDLKTQKDEINKIIQESDRDDIPYNPERISADIDTNFYEPLIYLDEKIIRFKPTDTGLDYSNRFDTKIDKEEMKLFLDNYRHDRYPIKYAMILFAREKGIDLVEFDTGVSKWAFVVDLEKFFPSLSSDDLKDINSKYRKIKKELVEKMIDVFENPTAEKNKEIELIYSN